MPRRRSDGERAEMELFKAIRKMPCIGCGRGPSDCAHIKSKGSGGDNMHENVVPLCRRCHVRQHTIGWVQFFKSSASVEEALCSRGWIVVEEGGRWRLTRA